MKTMGRYFKEESQSQVLRSDDVYIIHKGKKFLLQDILNRIDHVEDALADYIILEDKPGGTI